MKPGNWRKRYGYQPPGKDGQSRWKGVPAERDPHTLDLFKYESRPYPQIEAADVIRQFVNALRGRDIIPPSDLIADGRLHRCDAAGRNGKNDAAYLLHLDDIPAGGFENHRDGEGWHNWHVKIAREFTELERTTYQHRMGLARAQREEDNGRRKAAAAERANSIWQTASPVVGKHPYLVRKQIGSHGLRIYRDRLVVPIHNADGAVTSLQFIDANGDKRFLTGGSVAGGYFCIGEPDAVDQIVISEGFATAATLHEATDFPTIAAFSAGNLPLVAQAIRQRYRSASIVIAADDDYHTDGNPGLTKAREAAALVEGVVAVPDFGVDRPEDFTDFNDLGFFYGHDRVREIIDEAFTDKPALIHKPALADRPGQSEEEPARNAPEFSEEALALEFAERHGGTLRFTPIWSKWFSWCGTHWRADDTLTAFHHSRTPCRNASGRLTNPKHAGFARGIASAKTVAAVTNLARADRKIVTEHSVWDADTWTLSGAKTVELRTGKTRDPHPNDLCTKITAVAPDTLEYCPLWRAFLHRVTEGDLDLQRYLQRVAGYCLTGETREHAIFFFYGVGANGKGVFLNTVRNIWNDYAVVASMETFVETRGEHHPTELAHLRGARAVIAQETERGRRWAESKIKTLTGGDPIAARYMRQDFFEFVPQFKLLIAGNHKPSLRAVDEAVRRRFHLVPFTVVIPKEERDQQLAEKLRKEWPGILRWAIDGCLEWQRTGLAPPKAVLDATEKYLHDEDALGRWIEERCAIDPIYSALGKGLYEDWKDWAEAARERSGSLKDFYQQLETRGFETKRQNKGVMVFGLALCP